MRSPRNMLRGLPTIADVAETWNRHDPLVLVCASGARSGKAAVALSKLGFTQVASLHGGMALWAEDGRAAVEILGDRGRQDAEEFVGMGI